MKLWMSADIMEKITYLKQLKALEVIILTFNN